MTADRAWRPSGPRLPPLAPVPFILVALIPVVSSWREWTLEGPTDPVGWLSTWLLRVLPGMAICLIGAAIVLRHPRAHRTVPLLLFGAILLAIQVTAARDYVQILIALFPESMGTPQYELYAGINVGLAAIAAFGWAYLASGLVRARRCEDVGPTRLIVVVAVVAALIPTALVAGSLGFPYGSTVDGILLMALSAAVLVASFAEKLAIGYMAVTATRGWLAGESPRLGWALAAIGAWLLLAALAVVAALPLLGEEWFQSNRPIMIFEVIALAYAAGAVALLIAFALGLPDVDGITWYDLAEVDAAVAGANDLARDPFDDSAAGDEVELFELEDRRLDR